MLTARLAGPARLEGQFSPPGDKSISHRAVLFGALAQGKSCFTHFLEAEDCLGTIRAFQSMGISTELKRGTGQLSIEGKGLRGLKAPAAVLDAGNSGTTMRLMLGILAGQPFEATLTGDASLSNRPMRRLTEPLKKMGAQIKGRDRANFAPLTIRGGRLHGIDWVNQWNSAQVKSALLFAGLYAEGATRVFEKIPSRDHTERFLTAAGAPFHREKDAVVIEPAERLRPLELRIPGDLSAAAFFVVGAAMTPGSEITVREVNLNRTRAGFLAVLKRMGANLTVRETGASWEPVGEIGVQGSRLKGTRITKEEIPSLIDEIPILMTAMALAEGESLISGAEELRVKETDRIVSMAGNLNALGGQVEELEDGALIRGVESFRGGKVRSFGDHRTAMSLATAALASAGEVEIEDTACVATSFPDFFAALGRLRRPA